MGRPTQFQRLPIVSKLPFAVQLVNHAELHHIQHFTLSVSCRYRESNLHIFLLYSQQDNLLLCEILYMMTSVTLFFILSGFAGIMTLIKCDKSFRMPGPGASPPVLFRTAGPGLPLLLLHLFLLSMPRTTFPTQCKTARIVTHYKMGSSYDPWKICLVNDAPILSKLMENVAK